MMVVVEKSHILIDADTRVSILVQMPPTAETVIVLAHGAGAGMEHRHMQALSDALIDANVGVLRFNFPYKEKGRKSVGSQREATSTIIAALKHAQKLFPAATLLAGGHSYGGRMTSHTLLLRECPDVSAALFFSFPLHAPGKPGIERASHLKEIRQPICFFSGTRDTFAKRDLFKQVTDPIENANVVWIEQADHSFRIPKKAGLQDGYAYKEVTQNTMDWLKAHQLG